MGEVSLNPEQAAALRTAEPGTKLVAEDGTLIGFFLPMWMASDFLRHLSARRRLSEEGTADTPHQVCEKRPDPC